MQRLHHFLSRFSRASEGIAAFEFAIIAPLLLTLFMGSIEVTRYVLITQKAQKTAMTIANVVAQAQAINNAALANIVDVASQIMQPYTFGANGYVIISSVTQTGVQTNLNPPKVSWQYRGGGNMNPAPGSKIGQTNGTATLPNNLPLNNGDNIIVTEVFYNYTPMIATNGILGNSTIYQVGLFKPRLGLLNVLGMLSLPEKGTIL